MVQDHEACDSVATCVPNGPRAIRVGDGRGLIHICWRGLVHVCVA